MIVNHPICLLKILVLWNKNYLTNRSQIVNYNNRFSSKQTTLWGVPPASVLGSLQYLLYFEDMSSRILSYIFFLLITLIEIFRFWDEHDYEYGIFSIVRSARAWGSVILAGKRDSPSHCTTSFRENVVVAKTRYQMLEVLSLCNREGA